MDDYFGGSSSASQGPPAPPPMGFQQPPQVWPAPPQQQAWTYQPAQQGMSTGLKVLVGIGIGIGALVVIGILAAIAIPVFLNQRAKGIAASTTVSMPPTVAGLALRTDAASESYVSQLRDIPLPGQHLAGAYGGTTRPEVLVGITKHVMTPSDQRDYLNGSTSKAPSGYVFQDADAGSLGGLVRCSTSPTVTICFFADAATFGSVVVVGTPDHGLQLVPQIRAAVEHRA